MPTTEQLRAKLIAKLRELFQLDQPDLDFGFYRIMHAKAKEVNAFLSNTLPNIIEQAFGGMSARKKNELQSTYDKAVETARSFGAPDPEATEPVKKAKAALEAGKNTANDEAGVYDHLYRFFERYYDNGDFVSLRYLTRETDHKAKPYAIPYGGEEVMLHWANADQYYIKTAENFNTFTFDLSQVRDFLEMNKEEKVLKGIPSGPMKVHFKLVDAEEGEHGNVKANEERFFILRQEQPLDIPDSPAGEMTVFFEYRVDPEKTGQAGAWKNKRNQEAEEIILKLLESWISSLPDNRQNHPMHGYFAMLSFKPQGNGGENRSILARYIAKYTARNTSDYFIHKDLGGFLKRELDFYIKNEIMQLDNIENADVPVVESYLGKIRIFRKIAVKLIEFLAQLEDFQKKLWLKKKFVVQSDYCITIDRIPEELYPEIIRNLQQWKEWEKLGFLTTKCDDQLSLEYTKKPVTRLTLTFPDIQYPFFISLEDPTELLIMNNSGMKEWKPGTARVISGRITEKEFFSLHPYLMIDTQFFDADFKARLLSAIPDLDEQCEGILIHSENTQALDFLHEKYKQSVSCVYIDPPYNTGYDGFIYKDGFQESSWTTMIFKNLDNVQKLMKQSSIISCSIDDHEVFQLGKLFDAIFFPCNQAACAPWRSEPSGGKEKTGLRTGHEFLLIYHNGDASCITQSERSTGELNLKDSQGLYRKGRELRKWGGVSLRADRPNQFYALPAPDGTSAYPIKNDGQEGHWRWGIDNPKIKIALHDKNYFHWEKSPYDPGITVNAATERWTPYEKIRDEKKSVGWSTWLDSFGINADATRCLKDLFGQKNFDTPKPLQLIEWFFNLHSDCNLVLDYFAGSGTTAHAILNLTRDDDCDRKYILVEMGDHFDTVLKPRIEKVVYSEKWKDGKPILMDRNGDGTGGGMGSGCGAGNGDGTGGDLFDMPMGTNVLSGISHCFKYMRLESYEDTLNNLEFTGGKAFAGNPELHEDYLLHYMMDVETKGSASLLNIQAFADPFNYKLKVRKPNSEESELQTVDLLETFNYLIGVRVKQIFAPQRFSAEFERLPDPELPQDQKTKLTLKGRLQLDSEGKWLLRKVEGWVPKNRFAPNDGATEKVLIIWRVLSDDLEEDNLVLDEFFKRECLNSNDSEFDTIYVNGSNNLPNLKRDGDNWKVRLIEEDFMNRMWEE